MYDDVWVLFTLKHVYQVQYHCGGPKWLMPDLVFSTHTQCPEGNNMFGGYGWSLNIGQCLRTNLQTTQGHTMATSQVHKSWIDPTLIPTNINGLSNPKDESRWTGCKSWLPLVPQGSHMVPTFTSMIFQSKFPIDEAIPSAVLVWDKHSRAKYLSVARSDAPFGCPRPGLESDNFGAEKKTSCKKNG